MITLTHKIEKYDVSGRPMITKLIFTVSMYKNTNAAQPYEQQDYAYHWLSVIDPTDEQIDRFKQTELAKVLYTEYGGIAYVLVRNGKVSGQRVSV